LGTFLSPSGLTALWASTLPKLFVHWRLESGEWVVFQSSGTQSLHSVSGYHTSREFMQLCRPSQSSVGRVSKRGKRLVGVQPCMTTALPTCLHERVPLFFTPQQVFRASRPRLEGTYLYIINEHLSSSISAQSSVCLNQATRAGSIMRKRSKLSAPYVFCKPVGFLQNLCHEYLCLTG
jgi:hypothetical protein